MNNSKLEKLMNSPTREGMRDRLMAGSEFWDYKDRRCRYHSRSYGQAYAHAEKVLEKNVGKSFQKVTQTLKNDPRYKHNYFFRRGVRETLRDVRNNSFNYLRFDSDYYLEDNILIKRETKSRYKYKKKAPDPTADYIIKYVSGVEIHRRKGIHYFLIERSYWVDKWHPTDGLYHVQIPDRFDQLSSYWLQYFELENLVLTK